MRKVSSLLLFSNSFSADMSSAVSFAIVQKTVKYLQNIYLFISDLSKFIRSSIVLSCKIPPWVLQHLKDHPICQ